VTRTVLPRRRPAAAALAGAGAAPEAGAPGRRAFTILEMIITVGAVGLIAVGLARLFSSTGETVRVGRRISALNETAATFERQFAADLAGITRDGPLVIRNKQATVGGQLAQVALGPDQGGARVRRVDSILFFTRGQFTSARYPRTPANATGPNAKKTALATSTAARVFYGHGAMRPPAQATTVYLNETPTDSVSIATWPSELGAPGPNQYAADWTLLRNVVLLTPPKPRYNAGASTYDDGQVQIALQPAAASVFGCDMYGGGYAKGTGAANTSTAGSTPWGGWSRTDTPKVWPQLSSGIVDIAAIDLGTIKARVLGATVTRRANGAVHPGFPQNTYPGSLPPLPFDPQNAQATTINAANQWDNTKAARIRMPVCTSQSMYSANDSSAYRMKRLMADLMPGLDEQFFGTNPDSTTTNNKTPFVNGRDLRLPYAPTPPDATGIISGAGTPFTDPTLTADQLMLSASNLAPGVTEFIVEWSFGDVYGANPNNANDPRTGRLIWHGMERYEDVEGNGAPRVSDTDRVCAPYTGNTSWTSLTAGPYGPDSVGVPPGLIHWPGDIGRPTNTLWGTGKTDYTLPVYSFFGYLDPSSTASAPWEWPKLIRVTMSLTDPADPGVEQRYQFVFKVPDPDQAN
jgi:type II secretory pathway pseudopilin PulG